jgi:hypothetical protein
LWCCETGGKLLSLKSGVKRFRSFFGSFKACGNHEFEFLSNCRSRASARTEGNLTLRVIRLYKVVRSMEFHGECYGNVCY